MQIIVNSWASEEFCKRIVSTIEKSNLPGKIKKTIIIRRSELDGQLIGEK